MARKSRKLDYGEKLDVNHKSNHIAPIIYLQEKTEPTNGTTHQKILKSCRL